MWKACIKLTNKSELLASQGSTMELMSRVSIRLTLRPVSFWLTQPSAPGARHNANAIPFSIIRRLSSAASFPPSHMLGSTKCIGVARLNFSLRARIPPLGRRGTGVSSWSMGMHGCGGSSASRKKRERLSAGKYIMPWFPSMAGQGHRPMQGQNVKVLVKQLESKWQWMHMYVFIYVCICR